VPDQAVVNASPLIFLSKADRLEFLRLVAPEILVPNAVAEEIQQYGPNDPTAQALESTSWLRVVEVAAVPPAIEAWALGPGESSVLAYAMMHRPMIAIIDDLSARHCAEVFKIPVSGTLGLVLTAKKRGVIPLARPVLEELRQCGMYLSDRVLNHALSFIGE
jgi:predicted nucleic acid-binding protein